MALDQGLDATGQPVDDRLLPGLEPGQVDADRSGAQTRRLHERGLLARVPELDQRLRRDAPDVQARTPHPTLGTPAVDHDDLPAELRRPGGGQVAARSGADDQQVDRLGDLADDHQRRSAASNNGFSISSTASLTSAAS